MAMAMESEGVEVRQRNVQTAKRERRRSSSSSRRRYLYYTPSWSLLTAGAAAVLALQLILAYFYFLDVSGEPFQDEPVTAYAAGLDSPPPADFVIPCPSVHKDAESALKRARTGECRSAIAEAACANEAGELGPQHLPNLCPTVEDDDRRGAYLGCFTDSFSDRLFKGALHKFKGDNGVEKCLSACAGAGFRYAGLQYGLECFCDVAAPPAARLAEGGEAGCDMHCPGHEEGETCGGYLAMSVYDTGVLSATDSPPALAANDGNPVKIVFLLTVSGRASRQVLRLIKRLRHPDHFLFIHVDSRADYMHRQMETLASYHPETIRLAKVSNAGMSVCQHE